MKYLTKKRMVTLVVIIIGIFVFLMWNNSTTPTLLQKVTFNEENAKQESRIALDNFLKVTDNKTFIANADEKQKIKEFISSKCNVDFTNDFINNTSDVLSTQGPGTTPIIFYLSSKFDKISFYNNYEIFSPLVDKQNETITYNLRAKDVVYVPTLSVNIEMKKENGKWKINKATEGMSLNGN